MTSDSFDSVALDVFRFQYSNNATYRQFCDLIGRSSDDVDSVSNIPFLPIRFFKALGITTGDFAPDIVFESSTTTGQVPSRHYVRSLEWYQSVCEKGFSSVYETEPKDHAWYGLLPSYLERPNASLVFMVQHFVNNGGGGFYIDQFEALFDDIQDTLSSGRSIVLIGVSFALLAFVEKYTIDRPNLMIVETGGMKGRGKELTRAQLHGVLQRAFPSSPILSEYGMTELLSQGWTKGGERFYPASTMKVQIRELSDPLSIAPNGQRGAINCIDLANIDSCAFIATDDAGIVYDDQSFEVLGRLDGSEQRGCNLMFENRI